MKTTPLSIVFTVCLLLAIGCSWRPPSDDETKNAFTTKIEKESEGRIKLIEFRKTAGQIKDTAGVKVYHLEYEFTIEFTADCKWLHQETLGLSFRTNLPPAADAQAQLSDPSAPVNQGEMVLKRDRRKCSGGLDLEQTEKGWSIGTTSPAPASIVQLERRQQDPYEKALEAANEVVREKTQALEAARKATKAAEQKLRDLQKMPVVKEIPIFGSAAEAETSIFKEATQQARAILDHDWVEHSDSWFSTYKRNDSSHTILIQAKDLKATLALGRVITAADRLNGLEWIGWLKIDGSLSRSTDSYDDKRQKTWGKWEDGLEYTAKANIYAYFLRKMEGKWTVERIEVQNGYSGGYITSKPLVSDIPPL
jgi:hypothetical protein